MTTSISSTGSVSSAGIGSGLDVTSIIDGLMKVETQPLTQLQTKATSIQSTISAFGSLQSSLSSFRDAVASIALPSTWNATKATSADTTTVSVASTSNATSGNYSVTVQSLASAQSTVSPTYTSATSLVGAGTMHIDIGSWSAGNSAFTAKAGSTGVDIAVTATDTLTTLASKINAANAGVGASVVNDASGSRLVLTSTATGTDSAFRVTTTDSSLSGLAYDPAGGSSGTSLTQTASNASATINGLSITSQSNTLANVFNGISLTLSKVSTTPVQITVAQDNDAIKKSVQAFADAYNTLSNLLATDLKYDSSTKTAGPLQGDSTAVSVQRQLRNLLGGAASASATFKTLSQVGLEFQTDGTLKVNDTKLSSAMANLPELKKMFTNVDATNPANNGIATKLRSLANTMLGAEGLVTTRVTGLKSQLSRNEKDQDAMNDRLATTKARLQAQYTALDTKMAGISTLSTYITQQIANWNKSS